MRLTIITPDYTHTVTLPAHIINRLITTISDLNDDTDDPSPIRFIVAEED